MNKNIQIAFLILSAVSLIVSVMAILNDRQLARLANQASRTASNLEPKVDSLLEQQKANSLDK
jgi:hypothetical protein